MKILIFIYVLISLNGSQNVTSPERNCECVPYYMCREGFKDRVVTCLHYLDVCCNPGGELESDTTTVSTTPTPPPDDNQGGIITYPTEEDSSWDRTCKCVAYYRCKEDFVDRIKKDPCNHYLDVCCKPGGELKSVTTTTRPSSSSPSTVNKQEEEDLDAILDAVFRPDPCKCVPYHQCREGFTDRDNNHCDHYLDVCCKPGGELKQETTTIPSIFSPTTNSQHVRGCVPPNTSPNRRFCSLLNGCDETCNFDNEKCLIPPGSSAEQVKVVCAPGYSTRNPSNSDIAFCVSNGLRWYPSLPECYKLCRPLWSENLMLTCRHGTSIVNCSDWALPETTVSFECAPTFSEYPELRRAGIYRKVHSCKSNGEWSESLPPCKAACGVFNKQVQEFSPTILHGQKAHLGFFPWHAGLYYRTEKSGREFWDQKCGGSLINKRFILTAAHCVKDVVDDVSRIRVALGKYYRSWDSNERGEQKRNVLAISVPTQFISSTLTFDIALVLLSESIKYGEYIMPVCLDLDSERNRFQDNNLSVVGWGKTSIGGSSSDVLLFNSVKAMTDNECRTSVPFFYTTFEKICAQKDESESITQQGDSGGGLTATYRDGLHYIVGIVSTKVDQVSIFTYIKWRTHIEWMESEMTRLERQYVRD